MENKKVIATVEDRELCIGELVVNLVYGIAIIGRVAGFHEVTKDPILQDEGGRKWVADRAKVIPAI